jgi:hypothetical protein
MTETLAPHERLALYNLTDEEIEKIEEELVNTFLEKNLQKYT